MEDRFRRGDVTLVVEIPPGFGRALQEARRPEIAVWIDGAMPFRGETTRSYVAGLAQSYIRDRMLGILVSQTADILDRRIGFPHIAALVEATLEASAARGVLREPEAIADALAVDHTARSLARDLLPEIAAKAI